MKGPTVDIYRKASPFGALGHEFGVLVVSEDFVGFASAGSPSKALQLVSADWGNFELLEVEVTTEESKS